MLRHIGERQIELLTNPARYVADTRGYLGAFDQRP
jgi:hypothetical protein